MTVFNKSDIVKTDSWGNINISMESLSFLDRILFFVALVAVLVFAFPHLASAQTIISTPLVFDVSNAKYSQAGLLPIGAEIPREEQENLPPQEKIDLLREYLQSKQSPMADYADVLLGQYHYRLIIGISFAESNFCKRNIRPHNCWGIGGGKPETYSSYPAAFERANQLIQRYHDRGMTTPKLMRNSWVGWENDSWILAVSQVTRALEDLGI